MQKNHSEGGGLVQGLKGQVIHSFLNFVAGFVPLKEAQVATLGGQGLEARIWSELGIPNQNGWLIERSRKRSDTLIVSHRYKTLNQLSAFDQILAGHGEGRAFVDALHLDLCGTFSGRAIADFAPALPLVLKGRGRCLAITVADSRRNLVLEQWPSFQYRAKELFGRQAEKIYQTLLETQKRVPVNSNAPAFIKPFDPEKASKREFGLLVELAELLSAQRLDWRPAKIERYVYVSRSQGRPFRMRTYFFHFGRKGFSVPEALASSWVKSQLFFANGETFQQVGAKKTPSVVVKRSQIKERTETMSRLENVARALGNPELEEYLKLRGDSERLRSILSAIDGAKEPTTPTTEANQLIDLSEVPTARRPRKVKKTYDDLNPQEQVKWTLKALEQKAAKNGKWSNGSWQSLLKEDFGYYNTKLGASLRAALAHTSGKYRAHFQERIRTAFGSEAKPYLDRLAKL